MDRKFKGPLFIIGKPRSGTKLMARIFEKHPDIAVEVSETQFIPYYLKNEALISNLKDRKNFQKFYDDVIKTVYFKNYHTDTISADEWYNLCSDHSFYNVIEVLLKYYGNSLQKPDAIWADKSNNYIKNVKILKEKLPTSKFIHIVRDVRDAALSSYNAWHTNVYRFSQRWFDDVNQIREDLRKIPDEDYIEFRYEDLLKDPETIIKRSLSFMGVEYFQGLLQLKSPSEAVGDAKGLTTIKSDNHGKYKKAFNKVQIEKIESVTWPLLEVYGYPYHYNGNLHRFNKFQMRFFQILDVSNRFKFDLNRDGMKNFYKILWGTLIQIKYKLN